MKNNQKGFVVPLLVGILALILAGGGLFLYLYKNKPIEPVIIEKPQNQEGADYLSYILENQVGVFKIGDLIQDKNLLSKFGYSIREETYFAEGMPQESFIISKNATDLLILYLTYLNKISSINIISPEFKTREGISLGSTISDFIKTYPNYALRYYNEEGESFILYTQKDSQVQFFLDRSDLLDPNKDFYSRKSPYLIIQPKYSNFKSDAKITNIRVYYHDQLLEDPTTPKL